MKKIMIPMLFFISLLTLWEIAVRSGLVATYLLPSPTQIFNEAIRERTLLFKGFKETFLCSFAGLSFSCFLGVLIGITLSQSKILLLTFSPYIIFFQTVPIIAIAPLLVIWFGYSWAPVIASSFIVSFFPMLSSTISGFKAVNSEYIALFDLHKATRLQKIRKLYLPSSVPFLLNGLQVAGGLAVIGAVVGEFMSGSGLGGVIEVARVQYRTPLVFAAITLSTILGLVFFGLSRILLKLNSNS